MNPQNLKPFKPGQSGNPSGRPKGIAAKAREHTDRALDVLVAALSDDDTRVQVTAAKEILDRGWGKPVSSITIQGDEDGGPVRTITRIEIVAADVNRKD